MKDTMWFRFLTSRTFAAIYARHMRWLKPKQPGNDDNVRAHK